MVDTARPPGSSTNSNSGDGDEKHDQVTAEKPQDGSGLGATPNGGKDTTSGAAADAGITGEGTKPTSKPDASKGGPGLSKYVPPWVAANVNNPASWKIIFRCWLASWAAFILILPTKNLNVLGNAYVHFFSVRVSEYCADKNWLARSSLFCAHSLCRRTCPFKLSYS